MDTLIAYGSKHGCTGKCAFRVFKISEELRLTFESLSFNKDDEVKFSYYEEDIGQPVLVKIEKID